MCECFKEIKKQMWDRMPKFGRWIFYTILIFMIIMIAWGAGIYGFFGW